MVEQGLIVEVELAVKQAAAGRRSLLMAAEQHPLAVAAVAAERHPLSVAAVAADRHALMVAAVVVEQGRRVMAAEMHPHEVMPELVHVLKVAMECHPLRLVPALVPVLQVVELVDEPASVEESALEDELACLD